MSYNLNFYPNDFNQSGLSNMYNPYTQFNNPNNINLQKIQQETENRLQQIQNNFGINNSQNIDNSQPYYLFCGNKKDWDDFLFLNYGITEKNIFDDYKLFLQAKQELIEEQGKNKINTMKDKIRNGNNMPSNIDSSIQSNVRPEKINGIYNEQHTEFTLGNTSEHSDGLLEPNKTQFKNSNKKK